MSAVVHCMKHPYDVYIGRWNRNVPVQSKWANPFKIGKDGTRAQVIEKYRDYLLSRQDLMDALPELRGKRLGCWCVQSPVSELRQEQQCHGEVLLELLSKLCL